MKRAKLVTTFGAVALIGAIGIGSTFAYLSDKTDTVKNTFTVGDVSFDDDFGAGLMESEVKREDGKYVDADGENTWTSTGNSYEDLAPAETVYKDPTIKIADDSEDAWVFAKVVYDSAYYAEIEWNTTEWKIVEEKDGYVILAKTDIVKEDAAVKTSTIFTSVTLVTDLPADEQGNVTMPDITISAYAIQAAGFDTYEAAMSEVSFE